MARKLALGLWVMLCMSTSLPAITHTAPTGWEYDEDCCSARDCAPVPEGAIRETQGGFSVSLNKGDHPQVSHRVEDFFQHGSTRIRVSGDSKRHACVWMGKVLCIYVEPGGV